MIDLTKLEGFQKGHPKVDHSIQICIAPGAGGNKGSAKVIIDVHGHFLSFYPSLVTALLDQLNPSLSYLSLSFIWIMHTQDVKLSHLGLSESVPLVYF
jgi:hypothetical protein